MSDLQKMQPQPRWNRLRSRFDAEGIGIVPVWAARWLYWNMGLYHLAHPPSREQIRLAFKYRRSNKKYGIRDPLIVYQMGKVGSSSLYSSLIALDLDVPVYKFHFLNDLDKHEEWIRQATPDDVGAIRMFGLARQVRNEMQRAPYQKWNLISLVRAPVPRAISGFFQNLNITFPPYRERLAHNELTAEELAEYFVKHYFDQIPFEWFDRQIEQLFGIDVYAIEFPKARGYQIYKKDNIHLLVFRLEDLNRCAAQAFHEFLNIPNFKLLGKNFGEQKKYGTLYHEFQEILRLQPKYVQRWHQSKYAKHFYTPEELVNSVVRWTVSTPNS